MKFIYSPQPETVFFKELTDSILTHKSRDLTIFLSGGSLINAYKYFVEKFNSFITLAKNVDITDFSFLTFTLGDERWFENLSDKNITYNQLVDLGFVENFQRVGAKFYRLNRTDSRYVDADNFQDIYKGQFQDTYKILVGGIGKDGHTCGIFSQDSQEEFNEIYIEEEYALAVKIENEFSNRITLTPKAILEMDEVILYVAGEEKSEILNKFMYEDFDIWEMPAQIYKKLKDIKIVTDVV
jgi:6-phosphogluconolactonase/glucosamine-6-phosphate isomerase/deaminase